MVASLQSSSFNAVIQVLSITASVRQLTSALQRKLKLGLREQ